MSLAVVILAAGKGRRFGGIKQLADINGTPLILKSIQSFFSNGQPLPGISQVNIVLGCNKDKIKSLVPAGVNIITAKNWDQGMGHSLGDAIEQLEHGFEHVFIALADQVGINTSIVNKLLLTLSERPSNIIAAKYGEHIGVPAIFPSTYMNQLLSLSGDKGARSIIRNNLNEVISLNIPEAKLDIDTQEDLMGYINSNTHCIQER
ncbi:nucleotidyltransferase family protein [Paraglaciecola sp.]|uniref:nucleotidyltransferase family protein n=1 Tax=Paraglaciecola sp. TaxID=1920173 RepID=UPI003EF337E2